jgi:ATP-binding cassette, subfamily C, bacterial CydD
LATAPLIPMFMVLVGNISKSLSVRQYHILSRLSGSFLDILQGLSVIKLFGLEKKYSFQVEEMSELYRVQTMKILKVAFLSALVLEFVATISIAIIAVEIGLRLLYDKMEYKQALFILILAPEFYLPLRMLGAKFHSGTSGFGALKRISSILNQRSSDFKKLSLDSKIDQGLQKFYIAFKNITYSYSDRDLSAVRNINLEIESGDKIAFIGEVGSGKTTTANLLMKFITAQSGQILFNDKPISKIETEYWRSLIAYIPQDPYLFNDTIYENLFIQDSLTSDELTNILKKVYLDHYIKSLPFGLNTVIGERGAKLSGGQAQRLSLARALIKQAPILILDEYNSHLDIEHEQLMDKLVSNLDCNQTVIFITHKITTMRKVDKIYLFHNGMILESGKYLELLNKKGHFYKLFKSAEDKK